MRVGTIIQTKRQFRLSYPEGSLALCYENYSVGDCFIFEDGQCLGIDKEDQKNIFKNVGFDVSLHLYKVRSPVYLKADIERGLFKRIFENFRSKHGA